MECVGQGCQANTSLINALLQATSRWLGSSRSNLGLISTARKPQSICSLSRGISKLAEL